MISYLVPKLDMKDISSPNQIRKMIENFLCNFADRYPGSGPIPYIGPLDEALKNSLFNTTAVSDFFSIYNKSKLYHFVCSLVHLFFIYIMIEV